MIKNKRIYFVFVVMSIFTVILFYNIAIADNAIANDNNIVTRDLGEISLLENLSLAGWPILLHGNIILFDSYSEENGQQFFGKYNANTGESIILGSIDGGLMTFGRPSLNNSIAYYTIAVFNSGLHLFAIDLENGGVESVFSALNRYPLATVSTTSEQVYLFSNGKSEEGLELSLIERYNENTKELETIILKELIDTVDPNIYVPRGGEAQGEGERIKAFATSNGKLYLMTERHHDGRADVYIEIYDSGGDNILGRLEFSDEIKSPSDSRRPMPVDSSNSIAQFQMLGDSHLYIQNMSGVSIVARISNGMVEPIFIDYELYLAYNAKNTQERYYFFDSHIEKRFSILDIEEDTFAWGTLPLQEHESFSLFSHIVTDGDNLVVAAVSGSVENPFESSEVYMISYEFLLNLIQN